MKENVLQFPTIVELIDFSLAMSVKEYKVNRMELSITAPFSPKDIELATIGYKASIIEQR